MKRGLLFFVTAAFAALSVSSQNHKIDSLRGLLRQTMPDTSKVEVLTELSRKYENIGNTDSSLYFANNAFVIAQKLNNKELLASVYNCFGNAYIDKSDYPKALNYYVKAEQLNEELGHKSEAAQMLTNIAVVYYYQGNNPRALDYNLKALKVAEAVNDKSSIASITGNIGIIYRDEGDYLMALNYYLKALKILQEQGNKRGIASNWGNIAIVYTKQHNYPKALEYYSKGMDLNRQIDNKDGIANNYTGLGSVYSETGDNEKALDCFSQALNIYTAIGSKGGMEINIGNMGEMYFKLKRYKESETCMVKAIAMADSIGDIESSKEFNQNLSELYVQTAQWQKAYHSYTAFVAAKDSFENAEKSKELGKIEAKAEYDKELVKKQAEEDKKTALAAAESKRQKIIIASVGAIALAVAIIAIIIFRSLRITRKQKGIIEEQKKTVEEQKEEVTKQKIIVEEKNKDILDSITYAKRLQDAILPPVSVIENYFPESFVLYKPKDIVAGDFYWMDKEGDVVLIAACDCTGHGVPGAMVSVVCSNALNRALKEFKIRTTGMILDKVREMVLETFQKNEGEVKDGMDVSFCAINIKTGEAEWSGAYNPLWYISGGEMKEITADKQPIGKYDKQAPFTTHKLNLQKGDVLYLFTDGYADQFGGPKGKKFKFRQMQQLMADSYKLSMKKQKQALEESFENWKGKLEQTDDVCVIGIRI